MDKTSALDIVTLVIAIIGVVLAAASLAWQGAIFVLSGSRVHLTLRRGALGDIDGRLSRATGPLNPTERDVATMREQGFVRDVLVVQVRNRGRLAVSVEDVTGMTDDGWGFGRLADPQNPSLPHRLEPGAKESWHTELEPFQMVVDNDGEARDVRMVVELGTGQVMRTNQSLRVEPRRQ